MKNRNALFSVTNVYVRVRNKELIYSLNFIFSFDISQAVMKQKLLGDGGGGGGGEVQR